MKGKIMKTVVEQSSAVVIEAKRVSVYIRFPPPNDGVIIARNCSESLCDYRYDGILYVFSTKTIIEIISWIDLQKKNIELGQLKYKTKSDVEKETKKVKL